MFLHYIYILEFSVECRGRDLGEAPWTGSLERHMAQGFTARVLRATPSAASYLGFSVPWFPYPTNRDSKDTLTSQGCSED